MPKAFGALAGPYTALAVRGRLGGGATAGLYFAPTTAVGLSSVRDYSAAWPFLDLMKMSREWSNSSNYEALPRDGVSVTLDGYPKAVPGGSTFLRTVWAPQPPARADLLAHEHTLLHDGTFTVAVVGASMVGTGASGTKITPTGAGLLELQVSNIITPPTYMHLVRSDPENGTSRLALFNQGKKFNPDFLNTLRGVGMIRLMDWQQTNENTDTSWASRALPTDCSYTTDRGVALEDCLALVNEIGVESWFCVPAKYDDASVDAMAALLRDGTSRALWLEYGNEPWNTSLAGTGLLYNHTLIKSQDDWNSGAAWGLTPHEKAYSWYGKRFAQVVDRFDAVFGGQKSRLRRVLGVQTGSSPATATVVQNSLHAPHWQQYEPAAYVPPVSRADYVALTWYYGSGITGASGDALTRKNAIIAAYNGGVGAADSNLLIHGYIRDIANNFSVEKKIEMLGQWNTLATTLGVKLCCYEGGNHTQQGLVDTYDAMRAYRLSTYERSNVEALWDAMRNLSNFAAPFMQFGDVGAWTKDGFWSAWESLPTLGGASVEYAQAIIDRTQAEPSKWWSNPAYPRSGTAPVITGNAAPAVIDGATAVGSYTANVAGYWTLTGSDASKFVAPTLGVVAAGAAVNLTFSPAPDAEAPTDTGGNNVYDVTLRFQAVTGQTTTLAVAVTVNPVVLSWTPSNLSVAPALWFDPSDGATVTKDGSNRVSGVSNKGSAATSLAQATAGKQPLHVANAINGLSALEFDQTRSDTLGCAWSYTGTALGVFGIRKTGALGSNGDTFLALGGSGTRADNNNSGMAIFETSTSGSTTSRSVKRNFANATISPLVPAGTLLLESYTWGGGVGSAYYEGALTPSTLNNANNLSATHFWLGSNADTSGTLSMNGQWGEVLVLGYTPTTNERQRIEGYLAWKHGVVSLLPGAHPYKSAPPA